MDSVTHTLFGLTLYGAVDKKEMCPKLKKAMLFTTIAGSQIPDVDVISKLWDTEGQYQMWHRGVTHSIFMVPVWALLLVIVCYLIWRVKDWRLFWMGMLAVFIHSTIDLFNAWGTGYFEPLSPVRVTFGTVPIVDLVIWSIIFAGFVVARYGKYVKHMVYKWTWLLIVIHIMIQSTQGYIVYQQYSDQYEQHALSASFMPWYFSVIGKNEGEIDIIEATAWGSSEHQYTLHSAEGANLEQLFNEVPAAATLYEWAPFVVIVEDEERLGIYDPRFYRGGQSFLFEYIEKGEIE